MKLTPLGLAVAVVVALPPSSNAQGTKPVVEREPVIKRGNPAASPKASPAPRAGAPAKPPVEIQARPTGEVPPPEDDNSGEQVRARPTTGEVPPPEDDNSGEQVRARPTTGEVPPPEDDNSGEQVRARPTGVADDAPEEDDEEVQARR